MDDEPAPTGVTLDFLSARAAFNDSLLQDYRGLLLTTQSVLIAVGTALLAIVILSERLAQALLASSFLTVLVLMAVYLVWQMRIAMTERAYHVDFWVRRIIEAEKNLPASLRGTTLFKLLQHTGRSNSEYWRDSAFERLMPELEQMTNADYDEILRPDASRRFFSRDIYIGAVLVWAILLSASWVYTAVGVR